MFETQMYIIFNYIIARLIVVAILWCAWVFMALNIPELAVIVSYAMGFLVVIGDFEQQDSYHDMQMTIMFSPFVFLLFVVFISVSFIFQDEDARSH